MAGYPQRTALDVRALNVGEVRAWRKDSGGAEGRAVAVVGASFDFIVQASGSHGRADPSNGSANPGRIPAAEPQGAEQGCHRYDNVEPDRNRWQIFGCSVGSHEEREGHRPDRGEEPVRPDEDR